MAYIIPSIESLDNDLVASSCPSSERSPQLSHPVIAFLSDYFPEWKNLIMGYFHKVNHILSSDVNYTFLVPEKIHLPTNVLTHILEGQLSSSTLQSSEEYFLRTVSKESIHVRVDDDRDTHEKRIVLNGVSVILNRDFRFENITLHVISDSLSSSSPES
jgi:hypothetical protein